MSFFWTGIATPAPMKGSSGSPSVVVGGRHDAVGREAIAFLRRCFELPDELAEPVVDQAPVDERVVGQDLRPTQSCRRIDGSATRAIRLARRCSDRSVMNLPIWPIPPSPSFIDAMHLDRCGELEAGVLREEDRQDLLEDFLCRPGCSGDVELPPLARDQRAVLVDVDPRADRIGRGIDTPCIAATGSRDQRRANDLEEVVLSLGCRSFIS